MDFGTGCFGGYETPLLSRTKCGLLENVPEGRARIPLSRDPPVPAGTPAAGT